MSGFSVVNTSTLTSVPALYQVTTAFAGAAVGDVLQSVEIYNQQVNPATVIDTVWNNLTQQTSLGAITPAAANITPIESVRTLEVDSTALFFAVVGRAGQYAINDVLQQVVILDPYTVPPTVVSAEYNNLTTNVRNVTVTLPTDIVPVGTPGTGVSSYSTVVSLYKATAINAGQFVVGDVLQNVQTFNPATVPPTVLDSVWNNLTQQTVLTVVPTSGEITPGGASGSTSVDVSSTDIYTVINAFGISNINDVLQNLQIYDPSTVPPTVISSSWFNQTQQAIEPTAPAAADIVPGYPAASSAPYAVVPSLFKAVAFFAGQYSIGDIIQKYEVVSTGNVPPIVISTTYDNLSTSVNNITLASTADIVPIAAGSVNYYTSTSVLWKAIATNAGVYTINDIIEEVVVYDPSTIPPTVISNTFNNINTGGFNIGAFYSDWLPLGTPTTQNVDLSSSALYTVLTAGTGTSVGDVLLLTSVYDPSTSPATLSSQAWFNLTTGLVLATAPNFIDITPANPEAYVSASNLYTVVNTFAGGAIGDVLENIITYDPTVSPIVPNGSIWNNLTQGAAGIVAPTPTDVIPGTSQATTSDFAVTTLYTATVTVGGAYNTGDILQSVATYNPATTPATLVDTIWNNLTQGTVLAAAPSITDITPGQTQNTVADTIYTSEFKVTSAGSAGTAVGNILQRITTINPVTSAVVATLWNNLTAGSVIAAPSFVNIVPLGPDLTPTYDNVTSLYYVVTAGTGYAVNDVVQEVKTYSTAGGLPVLTTTEWNNLTQGAVITPAPTIGNLLPIGTPIAGINNNYSTVTNLFYAGVTIAPYSINDQLCQVIVFDMNAAAPAAPVSETWFNLSQLTTLASPPPATDIYPGTSPVGQHNYGTVVEQFVAIATATDYNAGDILDAIAVVDLNSPAPMTIISLTWFNLTQQTEFATSPPTTDLQPIGQSVSHNAVTTLYAANTANVGIGYAIGDTISKVQVIDDAAIPPTVLSTVWTNVTTDTVITAPVLTELTASQSQLPPALGPQTTANSLSVYLSNPSALNYFPVVTQYIVTTAFAVPLPGGAIGDTIQQLEVYDATTSPATIVSTTWTNLTTGAVYPSAPPIADLSPTAGTGLTNAELRAAPVQVINPPASRVSAMITVGASASGSTSAGIVSASFYNNSTTVAATVAGGSLPPSTAIQFQANGTDTLAAIAYSTAAGGSLLIATLT